jgi:hypothetical protein
MTRCLFSLTRDSALVLEALTPPWFVSVPVVSQPSDLFICGGWLCGCGGEIVCSDSYWKGGEIFCSDSL